MTLVQAVVFDRFRVDPAAARLFEGERAVALRRRTWDVLCALLARAGDLVSKEDLLSAVWSDAIVSEQTLSTSIAELRRALDDDPRNPRFVETVRGRGFRFVARVTPLVAAEPESTPIGRSAEAGLLIRRWRDADGGRRRVVFISGEVGVGKTTLVQAFVDRIRREPVRVATGLCIEHHGEGEAFMPVVDAVRHLCRGDDGAEVARTIRANAPSWLVELLGAATGASPIGPIEQPSTRAQTLRCLAEVLETLAADSPLVLVLEDMHWSDASTVDLLNLLGRRRDAARLLVLATLRPADARIAGHPVTEISRSLSRGAGCDVVELRGLTPNDGRAFLARCLDDGEVSQALADALVERTGGNPFYMAEIVRHLLESGAIDRVDGRWRLHEPGAEAALPEGILATLEPRIARLDASEQRVLEVAALLGNTFSARLLTDVLEGAIAEDEVDALCLRLSERREWIEAADDGAYRFRHALGADALRRRLRPESRRALHARIARILERSGKATPARIADHFARAAAHDAALPHYEEAIGRAKRRFADREVAVLCAAALEQLSRLPANAERAERELRLQLELGAATLATRGYSAPEQAATFGRVCELATALEQPIVRFVGAGGLFFHHLSSGNVAAGLTQAEQMVDLAVDLPSAMRDAARTAVGVALFNAGELSRAEGFLERPEDEASGPEISQIDVPVFRLAALAKSLAHRGELDRARCTMDACVARAASRGRPFDLANGHRMAAEFYAILNEIERVRAHAERTIALSESNGFVQLLAIARLFEGWASAQTGPHGPDPTRSRTVISEALSTLEQTGYRLTHSAFRVRQAEAALCAGDTDAATHAVEAGLAYVEESGERRHESDLLRLQGRSRLADDAASAKQRARASFERARAVAARQGALLLELRALTQIAALRDGGGAAAALRGRLAGREDALPAPELELARRLLA